MCALAGFQDWPEAGVGFFTHREQRRISKLKIPGDGRGDRDYGDTAYYYPRRPVEDVRQYRYDWAERMRWALRAAGTC